MQYIEEQIDQGFFDTLPKQSDTSYTPKDEELRRWEFYRWMVQTGQLNEGERVPSSAE